MEMARNLVNEAEATVKVADARNRELEKAGDSVYATCESCHTRYIAGSVQ
jgi:cytochrome c2